MPSPNVAGWSRADGWYEGTGPKGRKTKWYFATRDGKPICFPGLREGCNTDDAGRIESVTHHPARRRAAFRCVGRLRVRE